MAASMNLELLQLMGTASISSSEILYLHLMQINKLDVVTFPFYEQVQDHRNQVRPQPQAADSGFCV